MMGMMHVQALKAPSFSLPSHTGKRVEVLSFNQSRASSASPEIEGPQNTQLWPRP